jgi:hypothetical protein
MIKLLVLADDFTGSLDTGVQFRAKGTRIRFGSPDHRYFTNLEEDIQVLIVDTESRHLPPEEAAKVIRQVVSDAVADVTVAYVAGKLFAGELPCQSGAVDSRVRTFNGTDSWQPCELSTAEQQRIIAMMQETGLSFARLDFMRTPQGLQFLEFNPNGQFAWIDYRNERGLYTGWRQRR